MERKNALDVVLLCGSPGSGKSSFYWKSLKPLGYERVNQDILKSVWIYIFFISSSRRRGRRGPATKGSGFYANVICIGQRDKCVKMASAYISERKSVAVGECGLVCSEYYFLIRSSLPTTDNTNADLDTRAVWVQLAQTLKVPIRCVYLNTPAKVCEHNDTVRGLGGDAFNPEKRSLLPHSAFSSFISRFTEPKKSEGFQDVTSIEFQVRVFLSLYFILPVVTIIIRRKE